MSDPLSDPEIRCDALSRRALSDPSRKNPSASGGWSRGSRAAWRWPRSPGARGSPSGDCANMFRTLFARRAPEATGEFIATQMSRLNEALLVSFGAMSAENLPAVDRVVKIVRELDRYQGFGGGARGTATRRKLLESLNSGAEMEPSEEPSRRFARPAGGPHPRSVRPRRLSFARAGAEITVMEAELCERPLHHASHGPPPPRWRAREERRRRLAFPMERKRNGGGGPPKARRQTGVQEDALCGGGAAAPRGGLAATRGTGMRRNPLESLDSGAGTATPSPSLVREDWSLRRAPRT